MAMVRMVISRTECQKSSSIVRAAWAGIDEFSTWDVDVLEVLGRVLGDDGDELGVEIVGATRLEALVSLPGFGGRQGPELLRCGRDGPECDLAAAPPRRAPSSS